MVKRQGDKEAGRQGGRGQAISFSLSPCLLVYVFILLMGMCRPAGAGEVFVLHLPGIGGHMYMDDEMVKGLREGGVRGRFEIYNWTCGDPGVPALHARRRNLEQAGEIAQLIVEEKEKRPGGRVALTAHSAGAGLAVWALERLPEGVMVENMVMIAPALSPGYDLTGALRHVRGKVYVIYSEFDSLVLGVGTSIFGTIDGVQTEAAGKVGFVRPANGDEGEYRKVVEVPYEPGWARYGNYGDHIGGMMKGFVSEVVAPMVMGGCVEATTRGVEEAPAPAPALTLPRNTGGEDKIGNGDRREER